MKKELYQIELVFENCSYSIIPVEYIKNLYINDIAFKQVLPYNRINNEILESLVANDIRIVFDAKADGCHSLFQKDYIEEESLFGRIIKQPDITSIILYYQYNVTEGIEKSKVEYGVLWMDDDCINDNQKFKILNDGSGELIINDR